MQIAFHIGANCTDEDRLIKTLLKNAEILLKQGIAVPGPGRYRKLIRETIAALKGNAPPPDTREVLLDAIVENDDITRVVMSNGNFISVPNRIFDHGIFYPQAEAKVEALHRIFPNDSISLYLGIRNPATFLQETFRRADAESVQGYLGMLRPEELRWTDVVRRIKRAAPNSNLTIWCNEDTPLLWDQIVRSVAGVNSATPLAGALDLVSDILTKDGMARLQKRLSDEPPSNHRQLHEYIAEIWDDHALTDQIEDEIDLPDLCTDTIQEMIDNYERDVDELSHQHGVTMLLPFT